MARLVADGFGSGRAIWTHVAFVLVWLVLVAGSRDALQKYYTRAVALLRV